MNTEGIKQVSALPAEVSNPGEQPKKVINRDELLEWRKSLETKCQLLTLLDKGGYVKDIADIKTDIERALADLDEIIKAFPDEDFTL